MTLDYAAGLEQCKANALAHVRVAYVLRDGDETAGFAVSHAVLAEEEAAKAVFCAMVVKGFLKPSDIEQAWYEHPTKAWVYHAVFRQRIVELEKTAGTPSAIVSGARLDSKTLNGVKKQEIPELDEHGRDRNGGFYVSYDGDRWIPPGRGFNDAPRDMVYRYAQRALALLTLAYVVMGFRPEASTISQFRIEERGGNWYIQYDER